MKATRLRYRGATLAEAMVGLAIFAMMALAVVGMLIQTAHLDSKDTELTETTFLADSLMEKRVSDARVYEQFRDLAGTPTDQFWTLQANRPDGLGLRYLYRVEVNEVMPAVKRVIVSVYHRDPNAPLPTPAIHKGRDGMAVTVGTIVTEPSR